MKFFNGNGSEICNPPLQKTHNCICKFSIASFLCVLNFSFTCLLKQLKTICIAPFQGEGLEQVRSGQFFLSWISAKSFFHFRFPCNSDFLPKAVRIFFYTGSFFPYSLNFYVFLVLFSAVSGAGNWPRRLGGARTVALHPQLLGRFFCSGWLSVGDNILSLNRKYSSFYSNDRDLPLTDGEGENV